ncbi:MAG: tRNA glutamyl-Q(34) synthetase GluQRS [Alphaproteobacteria bacterium]|nr:tRNA glutamyl-Q(34) synthetase GluQRS [Alphaproteobacteria bacterium]
MPTPPVTRFAPSPTGALHLGHAFAAILAHDLARAGGGRFLVRIEDIDAARSRPEFEAAILADLAWLGLAFETPVRRQSEHVADYAAALRRLASLGVLYPCFCTRREIAEEVARSAGAPQGPDGPLYPGTCRALDESVRAARIARGEPHALRLDAAKALAIAGALAFREEGRGPAGEQGEIAVDPAGSGDVVLARKDFPASYHLAVTVDDAAQGVTLVTRGEDLFAATHVHRVLQALLGLPVPRWHHHALVRDAAGARLAKRSESLSLAALRAAGARPADIRARLGLV